MGPAVTSREHQRLKLTRRDFFSPNQNSTKGARRMDPIRRGESVRRSLFGPVDHDELRRDLALKLREFAEQDSRRWNFNFQTETPLAGMFQWDKIPADGAAAAAAVHQECARPRDGVCSPPRAGLSDREDSSSAGTDQENRSGGSSTRKRPAEATAARRRRRKRRRRTLSKPAAKPGSNARITDFFSKRRRTTETRRILNQISTHKFQ